MSNHDIHNRLLRTPLLGASLLLGFGSLACDEPLDSEAELALELDEDAIDDALEVAAPDIDLDDYEFVADLDTPANPEFATSLDTRERWGLELEDGIYMLHGASLYRYRGEVPTMPVYSPEQLASPGALQPGEVYGEATERLAITDWAPAPEGPAPTPESEGGPVDSVAGGQPVVPVVLLGTDDRTKVTTTTTYPARTVGKLLNGCTATLIGPRHAITAAHCIDGGGSVQFVPGQNGDGTTPNGGAYTSTHIYLRVATSTLYDYGVIGLPNNANIASLGWMGQWWDSTTSNYVGKTVYLKGYPGSGQTCPGQLCGGFMWSDNDVLDRTPQTTGNYGILYYDIDATGGNSGSAIYSYFGGLPAVLAVHKRGNESSCGDCSYTSNPADYNVGARLTQTVANDICWMMGEIGPSSFASHPCT